MMQWRLTFVVLKVLWLSSCSWNMVCLFLWKHLHKLSCEMLMLCVKSKLGYLRIASCS